MTAIPPRTDAADDGAALDLELAGRQAEQRGSVAEGAALMEEAARHSAYEAPRLRRLALAGRLWVQAGEPERAVEVLDRASEPRDAGAAAHYHVTVLGGFTLSRDGVGLAAPTGMAGQLLKVVAVRGRLSVDELAEVLWPGAAPGAGRTRIRNVLSRLRSACGDVVIRHGVQLRLAPGTVVDREAFERGSERAVAAAAAGDPGAMQLARAAMDLYEGELLPGDRLVPWTTAPRERLERRFDAVLDLVIDHAVAEGYGQEAVRLMEVAIGRDPYDERRYVQAARWFIGSGQRSAAVSMLRRARTVATELGVAPSTEVEELERTCRWDAPLGHNAHPPREMGRRAYDHPG